MFLNPDARSLAEHEIIQNCQRWKIERVLIQHAQPQLHGLIRSTEIRGKSIDQDGSTVFPDISGHDLHQGAFASAVFPQYSMNGAGFDGHTYSVIGPGCTIMFVDVVEFDSHKFRLKMTDDRSQIFCHLLSAIFIYFLELLWPAIPSRSCLMYHIC